MTRNFGIRQTELTEVRRAFTFKQWVWIVLAVASVIVGAAWAWWS